MNAHAAAFGGSMCCQRKGDHQAFLSVQLEHSNKSPFKNGFELIASERDELPDAGRFGTDSLRVVSKMIADAQAVENPAHQGNQAVA